MIPDNILIFLSPGFLKNLSFISNSMASFLSASYKFNFNQLDEATRVEATHLLEAAKDCDLHPDRAFFCKLEFS